MTDTELWRKSRPRKYEPVKGFDEPFTEVLQKASISKNLFDLAMLPELTAINVEAALERRKFFSDRAKVRPAQAPLMHRSLASIVESRRRVGDSNSLVGEIRVRAVVAVLDGVAGTRHHRACNRV